MRLTQYTDFSLRVLIYLGLQSDRRCTIREISEAYGVSRNHLMKVVQQLAAEGYVVSTRGVGGGLTLAHPPEEMMVGDLIRAMEPDLGLVECLRPDNECVITGSCRLTGMLKEARTAFLDTLDQYSLADILHPRQLPGLSRKLGIRLIDA
ncbi:Rrf2 family transcriptional regulator [Wenzhouxiangella sp. AB-CW3]|uniref:RrF2 family transcriptional regulator n=1 Tax=Wenzhouxiangella sp. AB-CW3 TaxID=2771012 RepID=UPI00168B78B5|nr:Rrf2 family transcriptional regulator [Wenzhouxiangella sp. AB-CW3]QOC23533.1 Rrf2 family transcriptional regulator [Wenzhouxiangella sp. AB-CW3]